jgi:hypothetical protein
MLQDNRAAWAFEKVSLPLSLTIYLAPACAFEKVGRLNRLPGA